MKTINKFTLKNIFQTVLGVSPHLINGQKVYKKALGNLGIAPIKVLSFIGYLNNPKQNYKPNTIHRYLYDLLYAIMLAALENPKIDVYFYKKLIAENRPQRPKRTKERGDLLTPDELKSIRKLEIPNIKRKYIFILSEYVLGTRLFETLAIKLIDCTIDGDIVIIIIRRGKGNRQRTAFMPTKLFNKIVKEYNSKIFLFEYCFSTGESKPYTKRTIQNWHKEISKALGKRVHPHLLKHCFVTNQLDNKTDISIISRIVGTSIPVLLDTYHHPDFKPRNIMKIQTRGIKI